MSHWLIEKGENDVKDTLSAVYDVVYLFWVVRTARFLEHCILFRKGLNGNLEPYPFFEAGFKVPSEVSVKLAENEMWSFHENS